MITTTISELLAKRLAVLKDLDSVHEKTDAKIVWAHHLNCLEIIQNKLLFEGFTTAATIIKSHHTRCLTLFDSIQAVTIDCNRQVTDLTEKICAQLSDAALEEIVEFISCMPDFVQEFTNHTLIFGSIVSRRFLTPKMMRFVRECEFVKKEILTEIPYLTELR